MNVLLRVERQRFNQWHLTYIMISLVNNIIKIAFLKALRNAIFDLNIDELLIGYLYTFVHDDSEVMLL